MILPEAAVAWASFVLLIPCLVAVVGLAKVLSPTIEGAVAAAGMPPAVVGIAIALMVLLPETWAAVRAALRNRMQISFNLALGSALATIGLTIPAVSVTAILLQLRLDLGLPPMEVALLALTLLFSVHDPHRRAGDGPSGSGAPGRVRRVRVPGDDAVR